MRSAALQVLFAALLLASPALAQHGGSDVGSVADVPEGPARIHGRVVRGARPNEVGGVEVVLYALPQAGAPGLRRSRTEPDGSFTFERITNAPETAYLVGARVGEISFPGERLSFKAGELDREMEIRVAEPTTNPKPVTPAEAKLRLDWTGGRLVVTETHSLRNASELVFYVRPADRERLAPAFRTGLPAGASELRGPLGILPEGIVQRGGELLFFGPIYPGSQQLSFSYALPVTEATLALRKRFPAGTSGATVLVPEGGLSVAARALRPGENVTIDGRSYRTLASGALRPGAELALELTLPAAQSDPSTLSVVEVRVFLEQDAAALTVREDHRLTVAGDRMLAGKPGEPLYRIALPDNARDIRFATDPPGIPLAAAGDGGIELAGPLPAGESEIEIVYHVPVEQGSSRVEFESSRAVPLLSIFVADTGVALSSERLHRRRPLRTEDRTYLNLEAFELEPGETVSLEISSLTRASAAGRKIALAATLLGAIGIAAALISPLRRGALASEAAQATEQFSVPDEREALYAAMRDLEEDFETGKLSEADHALLRNELRSRAALLLQAEREIKQDRPQPAATTVFCTQCGAALRSHDRFCPQCGTGVAGAAANSREAST